MNLQTLEKLEVKRITEMQQVFKRVNDMDRDVLKILGKCCDGIDAAIVVVNSQKV